jgi:uncharacterized membrane protein YgaE (UPF0421/DUF939 family)
MQSKITFSDLAKSKALEIKMTNILSFYENLAISLSFDSEAINFEILTEENHTQKTPQSIKTVKHNQPLFRSDDIVNYLIERERRQSVKFSVNS